MNKKQSVVKKEISRKRILKVTIFCMFLTGIVLVFNKSLRNILIATKSNHYQLERISKVEIEQNKKEKTSFDFSGVKTVDFNTVLSSQFNSQDLPVIGGIAIPELKINLPIFKGVGNTSLLYGAGTMKSDEEMGIGNYSLAGHNMSGFYSDLSILFTPLKKATAGMIIYLTDKYFLYQYIIDKISTVTPDHVEVINDNPSKTEITLVTCADAEATHRIIVHGTYISKSFFNSSTVEIKKAFAQKYNQLNNW